MGAHHVAMVPDAGPGAGTIEVLAPYDRRPIATVEVAGGATVERALATAHRLFRDRDAWLEPAERIAILHRTARLMEERAEELALGAAPKVPSSGGSGAVARPAVEIIRGNQITQQTP